MVFHGTQCMSIGFLMDGRSWMEEVGWKIDGERTRRDRERERGRRRRKVKVEETESSPHRSRNARLTLVKQNIFRV